MCCFIHVLSGYRSIPLKNSYSEELELASLLVHIEIVNAKVNHWFLRRGGGGRSRGKERERSRQGRCGERG